MNGQTEVVLENRRDSGRGKPGCIPEEVKTVGEGRRGVEGLRLIRYGVAGGVNTLVDFGILNLLIWIFQATAGVALVLCNGVAFAVASINAYFLHKVWTFEEKSNSSAGQYVLFLVCAVGGLVVNSLVIYLLTKLIFPPDWISPVLWANIAKACATAASMIWNYLTYRQFVFREKAPPGRQTIP